jgi:RNA polymerase sigma-70 factor, ECF subfamily
LLRAHWWAAVAQLTRWTGDLGVAEHAVQQAVEQWDGEVPPLAWLLAAARDRVPGLAGAGAQDATSQLGLLFLCCHPALSQDSRVALTLRAVCGLTTAQIAAAFAVPEPVLAARLDEARGKIRDTMIPLRIPDPDELAGRLAEVLRVVYLVFAEGHRTVGPLSATAIELARTLSALLPGEPEVTGLLALLLLTDARRPARLDDDGNQVLLADHDRARYDQSLIAEGEALLERALHANRPGAYQIQAAIAACHVSARVAGETDWREIAALYGELARHDPSPMHEANRAVAVAMADGPVAGLAILDRLAVHPDLERWTPLHIARAALLTSLNRPVDARSAYQRALESNPTDAERAFIHSRLNGDS